MTIAQQIGRRGLVPQDVGEIGGFNGNLNFMAREAPGSDTVDRAHNLRQMKEVPTLVLVQGIRVLQAPVADPVKVLLAVALELDIGDPQQLVIHPPLRHRIEQRVSEGAEILQVQPNAEAESQVGQGLEGVLDIKPQIVPRG
jgi:hypothetical protein